MSYKSREKKRNLRAKAEEDREELMEAARRVWELPGSSAAQRLAALVSRIEQELANAQE